MSSSGKTVGIALIAALAIAGCASQNAGNVSPLNSGAQSGTGETAGSMEGTVSGGGSPASSPSASDKEQRGNTPPGLDRDGHGPASGAIVDPTGAATQRKPY